MKTYQIIGLMSGTSLDGLDIAHCEFQKQNEKWSFKLIHFETTKLSDELFTKLNKLEILSAPSIFQLDKELGQFYAKSILDFLKKHHLDKAEIDAVASHGQTIFHQPQNGFTCQIGCGQTIAALTSLKVINDFRTKDVIFGGQGAPLVPIGDFNLFQNEAESFLNIGGFANISFKKGKQIIAYDICPGNLPLNKLANLKGLTYDKNGSIAKSGELNFFLLDLLNKLTYYTDNPPKSLGTEWLESEFYPLIKFDKDLENNLRTIVEHEAVQIASVLNENKLNSVMISGGGALNAYLIERITHYYSGKIILPSMEIIEFKEAIIFGFLGVLFLENQVNCLASVTGASKDVKGGVLHLPD